jgi:hypothetical protein
LTAPDPWDSPSKKVRKICFCGILQSSITYWTFFEYIANEPGSFSSKIGNLGEPPCL